MCEKFSRVGASSKRPVDSAKAIQGLLEEGMVGRGHANEEYSTADRFVN